MNFPYFSLKEDSINILRFFLKVKMAKMCEDIEIYTTDT
jgi:hypothetical protein